MSLSLCQMTGAVRTAGRRITVPLVLTVLVFLVAGVVGIPHEDSSILYSYARSLAETGRISYYPGGEVVEGATAFLWMLLLAAGVRLGVDPHLVANLLNVVACGLVVWAAHLVLSAPRAARSDGEREDHAAVTRRFCWLFFPVLLVTGVAAAPQLGFSTLLFTALIILAGALLWRDRLRAWAIAAVLACLVRPDGVIYVGALGLAQLGYAGWFRARAQHVGPHPVPPALQLRWLVLAGATVAGLFAAYWAWRASYFGALFPLPYHVKSGRAPGQSVDWLARVIIGKDAWAGRVALSLVLLAAMAAMGQQLRRRGLGDVWGKALIQAVVVAGVGLAYLSRFFLQQNIGHRFEATVFLLVLFWFCALAVMWSRGLATRARRLAALAFVAVCAATTPPLALGQGLAGSVYEARENNIRPLALALRDAAAGEQVSLLVTEAGRFTYYSGFPTVDAWGLNTPRYAGLPLVDPADVVALAPSIISLHGSKRRGRRLGYLCDHAELPGNTRSWIVMTQAMMAGAARAENPYEVYAIPVWNTPRAPRRDLVLLQITHPRYEALAAAVRAHGGQVLGLAAALHEDRARCRAALAPLRS